MGDHRTVRGVCVNKHHISSAMSDNDLAHIARLASIATNSDTLHFPVCNLICIYLVSIAGDSGTLHILSQDDS